MVYEYERAGKLPARKNGGWDVAEARKALAKNVGAKQGGVPRKGDRKGRKAAAKAKPIATRPRKKKAALEVVGVGQEELELTDDPNEKSKAELEKEVLIQRAEKMRLENEEQRRVLVNRADVESSVESRFRQDAEALLTWPSSVSAELASELGVQERILFPVLDRYVRQFMRDRSNVGVAA
jgi:hypothetical protein